MKAVVQRVKHASVVIDGEVYSSINEGLLVLAGITHSDTLEDLKWVASKLCNLRIMNDSDGIMNLSIMDTGGELLIVSQFTLHAAIKKGNRPSYINAARPEVALPLIDTFIEECNQITGKKALTGVFGADMKVELLNDGPVTILIDSKNRE